MEIFEFLGYFDVSGNKGSEYLKLGFLKTGHMIPLLMSECQQCSIDANAELLDVFNRRLLAVTSSIYLYFLKIPR